MKLAIIILILTIVFFITNFLIPLTPKSREFKNNIKLGTTILLVIELIIIMFLIL